MPTIAQIQRAVCEHYGVAMGDLLSDQRAGRLSHPRQLAYLIAREMTSLSYPQIARKFADRDHSTILYGVARARERCMFDCDTAHDLATIMHRLATSPFAMEPWMIAA